MTDFGQRWMKAAPWNGSLAVIKKHCCCCNSIRKCLRCAGVRVGILHLPISTTLKQHVQHVPKGNLRYFWAVAFGDSLSLSLQTHLSLWSRLFMLPKCRQVIVWDSATQVSPAEVAWQRARSTVLLLLQVSRPRNQLHLASALHSQESCAGTIPKGHRGPDFLWTGQQVLEQACRKILATPCTSKARGASCLEGFRVILKEVWGTSAYCCWWSAASFDFQMSGHVHLLNCAIHSPTSPAQSLYQGLLYHPCSHPSRGLSSCWSTMGFAIRLLQRF